MKHHWPPNIITDERGNHFIKDDWFPAPLPANIFLDEMSYPDTAYSFTTFYSKEKDALSLGYASGNYGHSVFTTGKKGKIIIGKYVVLQCVRIVCNMHIEIADHCMFSWGSTITDSWPAEDHSLHDRKKMLETAAFSSHRHIEFSKAQPVYIEENVWVGFEAIILPGVTIGRGAIIGSKAVISRDIPPYAVVVGAPGRIVRFLDPTDTPEQKQKAFSDFNLSP